MELIDRTHWNPWRGVVWKPATRRASMPLIAALSTLALALPACSMFGGGGSSLRIESDEAVIQPAIATAIYRAVDSNTADIFLSDFPPDVLAERLSMGASGPPGTFTHIHLFVEPKAGQTPIDFTATSATARYIVFTGSSFGIYGGGGFLLPSDDVGDSTFSGRIEEGTLKLIHAEPGFADRLGLCQISGRVTVKRDDAEAERLSVLLSQLLGNSMRAQRAAGAGTGTGAGAGSGTGAATRQP